MGIREIQISRADGFAEVSFRMELENEYESDVTIANSLAKGLMYENEISSIFIESLRPGDTVIDVGANVGWFTLLARALVGPAGRVISFEPAPANVAKLNKNITLNKFTNITVIAGAVSDETGEAKFYLNAGGNGGHALWEMRPNSETVSVAKFTLNNWCKTNGCFPRLLKIDTEGHDAHVLKGASRLLRRNRTPYIISELHSGGLRASGTSSKEMTDFMRASGYETFLLKRDFPLPILLPEGTEISSRYVQNLLFASPVDVGSLFPVLEISPEATDG